MKLLPNQIKDNLSELNFSELRRLASQSNNLEAFNLLEVEEDYEATSKLLKLENEYQDYLSKLQKEDDASSLTSLKLISDYHQFLMGKICFPEA